MRPSPTFLPLFPCLVYFFLCLSVIIACASVDGEVYQSREIQVKVIQKVAPDGLTRSITFLSSGFLVNEEKKFDSIVAEAISTLYTYTAVKADPWIRYADQLNIFSVFQPSSVSGIVEGNNMGCIYLEEPAKEFYCSLSSIQAAASLVTQPDIIMVLANSANTTGVGGNGIGVVTTGAKYFSSLFIHYLSRALANLAEEFSEGFEGECQADNIPPNCASSRDEAQQKWKHWYSEDSSITPAPNCTFSNYFSFSSECIMRSTEVTEFCAVCRESINMAFFEKGIQKGYMADPTSQPISLFGGQCPPAFNYIVAKDAKVVLYAGDFSLKNNVVITWEQDGSVIGSSPYLVPEFTTADLPITISLTIQDNSPYIEGTEEQLAQMKQTRSFYLVEAASESTNAPSKPSCYGSLKDAPEVPTALTYCPTGTECFDEGEWVSPRSSITKVVESKEVGRIEAPKGTSRTFTDNGNRDFSISKGKALDFIPLIACGFIFIFYVILVTTFYFSYVRYKPREVLNVTLIDHLVLFLLCFFTLSAWLIAIFALATTTENHKHELVVMMPVCMVTLVVACVAMLSCLLNYVSAFMRWYFLCVLCGSVDGILGITEFVFSVYAMLASFGSNSDEYQYILRSRWQKMVADGTYTCPFQEHYNCSGFYLSCFQLDYSDCSTGCHANSYMAPCGMIFTDLFAEQYDILCALGLTLSFLLVLCSVFNTLFTLRHKHLANSGRFRREFRQNPYPPVMPITFTESDRARRSFKFFTRNHGGTMTPEQAVDFLQIVFVDSITEMDIASINQLEKITFDELMFIYFPFTQTSQMDPRMLTPDEVELTNSMLQLEKKQYLRLERFQKAAGTLSPEALHQLFQEKFSSFFLPNEDDILPVIEEAAKNEKEDEGYWRGLNPAEIEGLRGLWVAVHPTIVGFLQDEELETFYSFSHNGKPCGSAEKKEEWKRFLDVRKTGKIGWPEFCLPFAKKALATDAREYLKANKSEVPPELVQKSFITQNYGRSMSSIFLPFEEIVPIERLVVAVLRRWSQCPEYSRRHGDLVKLYQVPGADFKNNRRTMAHKEEGKTRRNKKKKMI